MVFYAAFNSISVISRRQITLFMFFPGFTSTRLGSEVSCPRTLPRKNQEDLVRLEPRTPGLRVKHLTTEPRGTLCSRAIRLLSQSTETKYLYARIDGRTDRQTDRQTDRYIEINTSLSTL